MSDEAVEGMENREEAADDVEGHGFDSVESIESIEAAAAAKEEPPDVEGHSLDSVEQVD